MEKGWTKKERINERKKDNERRDDEYGEIINKRRKDLKERERI